MKFIEQNKPFLRKIFSTFLKMNGVGTFILWQSPAFLCACNFGGCSGMIWAHLTCSNFIVFSLNTKQLLDQHIPLLGLSCTSLPALWERCLY